MKTRTMLDSIKRWLGQPVPQISGWADLSAWARMHERQLRPVREPAGFVVEGRSGDHGWRLEWGPSQRGYIPGAELRLRAELSVPRELQALVLNRALMDKLESTVFDQYVEGVQTRIDTDTPPEMRWLVMFPRLSATEMGALRDTYGALASIKPWVQQWLAGSLSNGLAQLPLAPDAPLVLMVSRRRLSLRTALPHPEPELLDGWVSLFENALRQAQRVSVDDRDLQGASTQPSLFPTSVMPAEALRKG